jgi:hypothetical protein
MRRGGAYHSSAPSRLAGQEAYSPQLPRGRRHINLTSHPVVGYGRRGISLLSSLAFSGAGGILSSAPGQMMEEHISEGHITTHLHPVVIRYG